MSETRRNLYVTREIPGIGGRIKAHLEDFYVEEIPLYEPSGEGRHAYLTIEKRGISTFEAVQRLADFFGVSPFTVGFAGMKDTRAVTVQRISIEGIAIDGVEGLELPGLRVLEAAYHSNKLRMGHLAGNRFRIRIRDPKPNAFETAKAVMEVLYRRGVPNFFGMQRFSGRRNGHRIGRALLLGAWEEALQEFLGRPRPYELEPVRRAREAFEAGDYDQARRLFPLPQHRNERRVLGALLRGCSPQEALEAMDRRMRSLFVSAYQSLLFNRLLARRLDTFDRLLPGDIAMKHRGGGIFLVENPQVEQVRVETFEISPTGPLFGRKMPQPRGVPRTLEEEVLREDGIDPQRMDLLFAPQTGTRRPLRVPVMDPAVIEEENGDITVEFRLPSGSYATVVVDEIMKNEVLDLFEGEEATRPPDNLALPEKALSQ